MATTYGSGNGTAENRYKELAVRRQPVLNRAYDYAELTIPSLLPREGFTQSQRLFQPYQGLGARLSVNLASRLMTALLPPGAKAFKLGIPPEVLMEAGQSEVDKDVELNLVKAENLIQAEIDRRHWRAPTFIELLYLIVTGNALEQMLPDNTLKVFRLDQYVVLRDPQGNLLEFVIEEKLAPDSLPEEARGMAVAPHTGYSGDYVCLYTHGRWDGEQFQVYQELGGQVVPGSRGRLGVSSFNALRWAMMPGEDYGRGKIEEHSGDLMAVEHLSKALVEGAALASRNITAVRPNAAGGLNLKRRIAKAANGDVIVANPEDISFLQFENQQGMQFTAQQLQALKQELSAAFLMTAGQVRQAERVTAFELRLLAEELEGTLGGVYSMLSQEMQQARIKRLLFQMQANGQLPDWPDGVVEPIITTGLEALGRQQDVVRVQTAAQLITALPPEVAQAYVKWDKMLGKAFAGLQLPDMVRTEDEAKAMMQQIAMAEALARGTAQAQQQQPTE